MAIILLSIGVFFIVVGTFGIFRLPDFFCRAHALTKSVTLGVTLVLISGWIYLGNDLVGFRLLFAILLLYFTIPLSGHILGHVAFRKKIKRHFISPSEK
jgi:multicomponent Na+:H+ antiporter subunit G